MNPHYYFLQHYHSPSPLSTDSQVTRAPPVAFLVRTAMRIARARWFSFLRRVFRYQNGPRSDLSFNPFNSRPWLMLEFAVLAVQIVVITIVMVMSWEEKPVWPLKIWAAGYNLGNLLSLPLLFWRYRCVSAAGSDMGQQRSDSEDSRISYVMNKSGTYLELFFAMWFVVGNVWIFDTRYRSFSRAPRLHAMCIWLLAWNAIVYSFPFVLFLLLCCLVPLVSRTLGFNMSLAADGRGASDDQISRLPHWRYREVQFHNQNTPENNECCICLAKYNDREEVRQLPCLHLFHQPCVDQWLRIISCCPLCKQELEK